MGAEWIKHQWLTKNNLYRQNDLVRVLLNSHILCVEKPVDMPDRQDFYF